MQVVQDREKSYIPALRARQLLHCLGRIATYNGDQTLFNRFTNSMLPMFTYAILVDHSLSVYRGLDDEELYQGTWAGHLRTLKTELCQRSMNKVLQIAETYLAASVIYKIYGTILPKNGTPLPEDWKQKARAALKDDLTGEYWILEEYKIGVEAWVHCLLNTKSTRRAELLHSSDQITHRNLKSFIQGNAIFHFPGKRSIDPDTCERHRNLYIFVKPVPLLITLGSFNTMFIGNNTTAPLVWTSFTSNEFDIMNIQQVFSALIQNTSCTQVGTGTYTQIA